MRAGLKFFFLGCLIWTGFLGGLPTIGLAKEAAAAEHAAYSLTAVSISADAVRLNWQIKDGFFLFKNKFKFNSLTDEIQLGAVELPAGDIYTDSHFGEQDIYREQLTLDVPVIKTSDAPSALTVAVAVQSCESAEVCYPSDMHRLTLALADTEDTTVFDDSDDDFFSEDFSDEPEEEFLDPI